MVQRIVMQFDMPMHTGTEDSSHIYQPLLSKYILVWVKGNTGTWKQIYNTRS